MSVGIESLTDEAITDYAFWALKTGLWNGRIITWEEAPEFFIETKSRIEAFLFSQDLDSFDFKKIAVPLAWIGSPPQERFDLLHDIEKLRALVNGIVIPAKNKGNADTFNPDRLQNSFPTQVIPKEILKLSVETQQTPVILEKPSIRQFVALIEKKLGETADPNYLAIIADPNYLATMQMIEMLFPKVEQSGTTIDNYASSLSYGKPIAPFQEIPLLGHPAQSTIHFHCGIRNNFSSVVQGGLCLNDSLDNKFAVQPHLVHSNNIVSGLTFVGLEKLNAAPIAIAGVMPSITLDHSQIQRSINYEVESLSQIAQNIIKMGNPNLKQVHVTFSNGGHVFKEALKLLPQEYRDTIIVITAGTTAIIENKLACEAYNLIGNKDYPSLICNGLNSGINKAKERAKVELIPQNETQFGSFGHYFIQPEYQDEISRLINKEIIDKYEIY